MFQSFEGDMKTELRRTLSHHSEEVWQKDDQERLDERVNDGLCYVRYCLQPAVRSSIFSFDLNSDGDLADAILKSIYQGIKILSHFFFHICKIVILYI